MRRFLKKPPPTPLVLALAALVAVSGVSSKGESAPPSDQPPFSGKPAVVEIFQSNVGIAQGLQRAVNEYTKTHPKVTIHLLTVGGAEDYADALREKMQSENPPEIFNIGTRRDALEWMGELEDLSDQPWVPHAVEGTLAEVTVDKGIYGLPYCIEGYGLIYNRVIFEDVGIDPEELLSFAAMEKAFSTLQQRIDSGALRKKYPRLEAVFELPAKETWLTGLHTLNLAFTSEYVAPMEVFDGESIDFPHANALRELVDLQAKYAGGRDPTAIHPVDYEAQVQEGIATERVACIEQGSWIYGDVEQISPSVAQKLGMMPLPLKGIREDAISIGVPMYWAVNSRSSPGDRQAAKGFLQWLYQSKEGQELVVGEFGFVSPFLTDGGLEPQNPLAKGVWQKVRDGRARPWGFVSFPADWGQETLGTQLQQYFAGKCSWEQVLETARSRWNDLRDPQPGSP